MNEPLMRDKEDNTLWLARNCTCCKHPHPEISLYWNDVEGGEMYYKPYEGERLVLESTLEEEKRKQASAVALLKKKYKELVLINCERPVRSRNTTFTFCNGCSSCGNWYRELIRDLDECFPVYKSEKEKK